MQEMNYDFQFSPSSINGSYDVESNMNFSMKDIKDSSEIVNEVKNAGFFSQNEEQVDAEIHFNSTNENTLKSKSSSLTRSDDIEFVSSDSSKKNLNLLEQGINLVMKSLERNQLQKTDKKDEYKRLNQQLNRKLVSDIFPKKPEIKKLLKKFQSDNSNINVNVELLGLFWEQLVKLSSNNSDQDKRESLISNSLSQTFTNQMEMLGLINRYSNTDNNELNLSEEDKVMKGLKNSDNSEKEIKCYLEYQSSIFIEFIKTNLDCLEPSYIYQTFIINLKKSMDSEYYKEIDKLFKLPKSTKLSNPWTNKLNTKKSKENNVKIIKLFKEQVDMKSMNSIKLK